MAATTRNRHCDGKCNPDARIDGRCMACGKDLSPAGYSTTRSTVLARHKSRSGRLTITVSASHTVRHTRWSVSITGGGDTGPASKDFTGVPLQAAKDYANECWAD